MNDLPEVETLISGYDHRTILHVRACTLDDIRAMATNSRSEYLFRDKRGEVRRCRPNGKLKTWKRDSQRFERSFSYGLYEHVRLSTQDMLDTLVFEV